MMVIRVYLKVMYVFYSLIGGWSLVFRMLVLFMVVFLCWGLKWVLGLFE